MKRLTAACAAAILFALPAPAAADATAFLGANTAPANRQARGFAVGLGLVVVGFEFEYASTVEEEIELAPSVQTSMFNVLVQTPFEISGVQPYATAGGGFYRERLGDVQVTNVGMNVGGGIKLALAGPIRLRLDYRIFRLAGQPAYSTSQRVYAGLNLRF